MLNCNTWVRFVWLLLYDLWIIRDIFCSSAWIVSYRRCVTMTTILIVTSLTATYLLIYIQRSFFRRIRNGRVAKALGCKPVATSPSGIFGISGFLRVNRAVREKQILEDIFSRFQEVGSHTFEGNMLGNRTLMTIEPENIKAMLATQFSDFGLGSRHEHFFPFLGDGIFTLDGHGWSQSRAMLRPQFTREMV